MAIKGKSKSRGARSVARGPKPVYVPIKTPWYRRRGLWLVIATLVAVAAIEGLVYGFANEREDNRIKDDQARLAAAVATATGRYRAAVEPILAGVGSQAPPSSFNAFPSLISAIGGLEADPVGKDALDAASSAAKSTASAARVAAGRLDDVDASTMVGGKGFSRSYVLYVLNSKDGFSRGVRLYREAAILLSMAVSADDGPARDDLVASARSVLTVADDTFGAAYSDYVQAQIIANVYQPPSPISSLTGATGPSG